MEQIKCRMAKIIYPLMLLLNLVASAPAFAQRVGAPSESELIIAEGGSARIVIVVDRDAGRWERKAAADLSKYIGLMSGAEPAVLHAVPTIGPAILVGKVAIAADPRTAAAIRRTEKTDPIVQSDAVSVRRDGERLYVAGSNDESHYFAASWLLQQWGCRWYMPTSFGEVIPEHGRLSVGALAFRYAPPFEIRRYWLSWNGSPAGAEEFQRRNFMSGATMPGSGHRLDQYTSDIAPAGGSHFNVPFADPRTAEHVAAKVEADYAAGKDINLAIADGNYSNDHPADRALGDDYDPYFLKPSLTDAMMTFYNNVARTLRRKHPESRSRIGGMAYVNVTRPPRRVTNIEPNIMMWIAPIDIDPNHAMDDSRSPPKREYRAMVEQWSKLLGGRLGVYDYDQGMLVWRDLPNPSHHAFSRDVKIYRDIGILGIQTESRGALATTFLNLFFRGQLMWNPDANVQALLKEFYPGFYGSAGGAMARYWGRIFEAWEKTNITEHEYLAIPAIYTTQLIDSLRLDLQAAEAALRSAPGEGRNQALYAERMRFTRASFNLLAAYVQTTESAARRADYVAATAAGERALEAQRSLRSMNPLFTSGLVGGEEEGAAWLVGEVKQYAALRALTAGRDGELIARLPLEWSFKVEKPLPAGWRYAGPEGPAAAKMPQQQAEGLDGPNKWRQVRTDLYLQGQDLRGEDGQSHVGHYWYRTTVQLGAEQLRGKVHLMFPGLFNEAWLYVNGKMVAHRPYREPWWQSDYRFQWDADVSGHLRPGENEIAVRGFNPHHFGGMFRRPFLYRPT